MTALSLDERLNQILPRVTSRDFLDSKGLGNEIGFWIFDYPPEREMDVRGFYSGTVLPALAKHVPPIRVATVYLLQLVTELLEERKLLDKAMEMQQGMRITLDLDDGVRVNYGKFGDLLAEVKAVTSGSGDE